MNSNLRALTHGAVAMAALGIAFGACAQSSQNSLAKEIGDAGPQAGKSFIDLSVGKSQYNTSCGNVSGLTCSHGTTSYSLTGGNMITDNVGIELKAMNLGKADRAGGSVIARGINLSAVGRLPLGESFALEGNVGPTYGVTHVTAATESGLVSGRANGVGLGYGVALDMNVARGFHGSVGWEQHDFKFAGQGRSNVKNLTLALGYTF
jgi:OmpA-OmpF porin, OOP family